MKTIKHILDRIEENDIQIHDYKENGKLKGYELNTYTNGGVNQIVFLDFRDTNLNPYNPSHFLKVYNKRVRSIDIDEEIELNRQDQSYKNAFSLKESVDDFREWKEKLQNIFPKPSKKTAQQRQFEQTKDKLESLVAQIEETLELMPIKGNKAKECQRTHLQQALNLFSNSINGIELNDFEPNQYSGNFKLSYF